MSKHAWLHATIIGIALLLPACGGGDTPALSECETRWNRKLLDSLIQTGDPPASVNESQADLRRRAERGGAGAAYERLDRRQQSQRRMTSKEQQVHYEYVAQCEYVKEVRERRDY